MKRLSNRRANFRETTKRIIALRSGYRCAHPECDGRTTVGPGRKSDSYENTGKASHIFAASKRGPRGRGNLSTEELRGVSNGLWLCSEHADQVDKNNGKDYPPDVLLGWKAVHEFRIAREHGAMLHPFGWIESLHIVDAPVFKRDQKINFANANVILGSNGVGKTAICEWLSALRDSSALGRWGAYPANSQRKYHDLKLQIDVRAPIRHHVVVEISSGRMKFTVDDQKVPFSPIGYEVSWLDRRRGFSGDDQAVIAKCLRMDETSVRALADHINDSPGIFLKGAEWQKEDEEGAEPAWVLVCLLQNGHKLSFSEISGGESGAVLFDLAIARARLLAMHRPTLLIVETGGLSMSDGFLSMFLETLSAPEVPFQSIIVTTDLVDDALWGGWQVIRLNRPPNTPLGTHESITEIVVGEMHRHQFI